MVSLPKQLLRWYGLVLAGILATLLIGSVAELDSTPHGLTHMVEAQLAASGVSHPVTAVLLNFRGYDTWLELGVLLLAALGVLLFQPVTGLSKVRPLATADAVLTRAVALLFPLAVLASGYLLWIGNYAAGGAFQAGVVLGAALILLWLSGLHRLVILGERLFRALLVLGFSCFLVVAGGLVLTGYGLLVYPPGQAGAWILLIEACGTLSIAWTMVALIVGLQPSRDDSGGPT